MATSNGDRGVPRELYDGFPSGGEPGFNRWQPAAPFDGETPFRVYTAKFHSSSREAEYFLHDPLATLRGEVDGIVSDVESVPADAYVTTMVINHHRTLAIKIIWASAVIDSQSVGLTIYKQDGSA